MPKSTKDKPKNRALRLMGMLGSVMRHEVSHRVKTAIEKSDSEVLKTRLAQAQKIVETLGQTKGAAMKLGQMIALEAKDMLPDEVILVLESLQSEAPPADFGPIRETLIADLGTETFVKLKLEETPVAAASIGQVHKGFWNGRPVAVKVQYPHVAQSIDADVSLLKQILTAFKYVSGKSDTDLSGVIEELREMFKRETDYLNEANSTQIYKENFIADARLIVPDVVRELSTSRVLTTSFEDGMSISKALRTTNLSADHRQFYGQLFLEIYVQEFCTHGFVQTDPNLGNFLLQPEKNKFVSLDFGATKAYTLEFRKTYSRLVMAALQQKREGCFQVAKEMGFFDPRESQDVLEAFYGLMEYSMGPFRQEQYDFSDDVYAHQIRERTRNLITKLKYSPPPREIIFLHRKLGGIFHILKRLEVKIDLRQFVGPFEELSRR